MTTEKPDGRYRVQSVERAIDILEHLGASATGLTVTEIADAMGGSKSGVFATLQTLVARGLIRSAGVGTSRRYALGLGLARLGDMALDQISFRGIVRPVLRELTERTGLTSRAAIWGGSYAIMIDRVDGSGGVRFDLQMGAREPLHRSSVGKAMLTTMTDRQIQDLLTDVPLGASTPHTLTTIDAVLADVSRARGRGYAVDDEEDAIGIICIGAPVVDHRGECVGAISVTRIKADITPEGVENIGRTVADSAAELSRLFGSPY
ncbi:MAG: IclR family transcriptional regulator [Streptosporangiaceae bacterium]|nr:IclR family transcriptional regulator [Streptosporangiaceae bacterium]